MTPAAFVALTAVVAVVALTPGPAVTAIVARAHLRRLRPALAHQRRRGDGRPAVFLASLRPAWRPLARSTGEVFTVCAGSRAPPTWSGRACSSGAPRPPRRCESQTARHETHFWRNYGAGLLLMFGHVQAMLFYAALLPGFVDMATLRSRDFGLIALMLVVVIGGVNAAYALLAARRRAGFSPDERAQRTLHRVAGTLMLVAAVLVVTSGDRMPAWPSPQSTTWRCSATSRTSRSACATHATPSFDIDKVLERLLLKGSIVVKKAYCDWDRYKEFKAPMHEASFELIEIPHVRMSGKNSADIRMVVDALDLCYTKSHVDTFVIVSGDSDFSPLVSKLRENNKIVIGVGVKSSTSDLLIANCDEFIYYDDLVRKEEQRRGRRRPRRRRASHARRRPDRRRDRAGGDRRR